MTRNMFGVLVLALVFVALEVPVLAHHAVSAEFDRNKPISFTGTVKKVEWMNPHIYTHIEAKDASGKTVVYEVEGGAPNALFRHGWRADTLKPAEAVSVTASRGKSKKSMRSVKRTITNSNASGGLA